MGARRTGTAARRPECYCRRAARDSLPTLLGPPPRSHLLPPLDPPEPAQAPPTERVRWRALAERTHTLRARLDAAAPGDAVRCRLIAAAREISPDASPAVCLDAAAQLAVFLAAIVPGWPSVVATALPVGPGVRPLLAALADLTDLADLADLTVQTALPPGGELAPQALLVAYERFLAAYVPKERARTGAFYTPAPVVDAVVGLVDRRLRTELGVDGGLASEETWRARAARTTLAPPTGLDPDQPWLHLVDPAVGTGAFLVGVLRRVHLDWRRTTRPVHADDWTPFVCDRLAPRLHGLDCSLPALVVAHIVLGATLVETGVPVAAAAEVRWSLHHADTLASPDILVNVQTAVILGNPPYARQAADTSGGGWIRLGHPEWQAGRPLLADYTRPVRQDAGAGHLKSLYNLYAYFWRWSVWRAFEHTGGPGIVGLVTASSFLRGPGFGGLRSHLRGAVDCIDVVDLEGDRRGPAPTDNVFEITTPVCVTIAWRREAPRASAVLRYACIQGDRSAKRATCAQLATTDAAVHWETSTATGTASLTARAARAADTWPRLVDLFPWQHSGVQLKRTWPIAETTRLLQRRWTALLTAADRAAAFRPTRARPLDYVPRSPGAPPTPPLADLPTDAPLPPVEPYAYRPLDRRHALLDARVCDRPRPALQRVKGPGQVFLTSRLTGRLGPGPCALVSAAIPDLHHFRGSYGGRDVVPLWMDPHHRTPNTTVEALTTLHRRLGRICAPEDLFAYVVAAASCPSLHGHLAPLSLTDGPRLPLTADATCFAEGVALGRAVITYQTYGARMAPADFDLQASCPTQVAVPIPRSPAAPPSAWHHNADTGTLYVGRGAFGPVSTDVMAWSVSGYAVVPRWLDARTGRGRGRRSSPLDALRVGAWTDDLDHALLDLLAVVHWTVTTDPDRDAWLARVLDGPLVAATDLPLPRPHDRTVPRPR